MNIFNRPHRFAVTFALTIAISVLASVASAGENEDERHHHDGSNLKLKGVASFSGVFDSVPVKIGNLRLETGPISLTLDTSAHNVFGLDNYQRSGFIDVTLLMTSPLFSQLGETPRIRIVESGPAHLLDDDHDHHWHWPWPWPWHDWHHDNDRGQATPFSTSDPGYDFLFRANLTGGGMVENGLFAGTVYENVNAYEGQGLLGSWIVKPGSTVTWDVNNSAKITFPDGTVVCGLGGSGQLTIVPEPASLLLAGLGAVVVVATARRRRAR